MKRAIPLKIWPALASLVLFAGLCAIIAYWALQLTAPAPAVAPGDLRADARPGADPRAVASMFGTPNQATTVPMSKAPTNIQVLGVASGDARASAIIAVDGAPGRFFAVGSTVTDGIRLVEVRSGSVIVERGAERSEIPAPLKPDLAVLTSGVGKVRQSSAAPPPPFGAAAAGAVPTPQAPAPAMPPAAGNPPAINSTIPNSGSVPPPGGILAPGQNPAASGSPAPGVIPPGAKTL